MHAGFTTLHCGGLQGAGIVPVTMAVQATREYYAMGGGTVAQRERLPGMSNGTLFWLNKDHLGGAALTTNTSGVCQGGQE